MDEVIRKSSWKLVLLSLLAAAIGILAWNIGVTYFVAWRNWYVLEQVKQELGQKEFTIDFKSGNKKSGAQLSSEDLKKALYVLSIQNSQLNESIRTVRDVLESNYILQEETR